jgi:hypothetical protein
MCIMMMMMMMYSCDMLMTSRRQIEADDMTLLPLETLRTTIIEPFVAAPPNKCVELLLGVLMGCAMIV